MSWLRTLLRQLLCGHGQIHFVRNIHGDEIIRSGYKRSLWRCSSCGASVLQDALVYDGPREVRADSISQQGTAEAQR